LGIQLVIADIDGTFLDSKNQPSTDALQAIAEIRRQGIKFTFCSGRGDPMVKPLMQFLNLDEPYITSGGAAIHSEHGGEIIQQELLSEEQIARSMQLSEISSSEVLLHTAREMYAVVSDTFWSELQCWEWMTGHTIPPLLRSMHWRELPYQQIIRLDLFNRPEYLPQLAHEIDLLNVHLYANVMRHNLEIIDKNVDKGQAISYLANYLNIPLANVMAVGDGINDMSMLEKAGMGVALQNSSSVVQKTANCLAPSNDEGGLAWALRNLLKGCHST
jgi:Cof subfamily protein (haloacid dehalogenase superfamily)